MNGTQIKMKLTKRSMAYPSKRQRRFFTTSSFPILFDDPDHSDDEERFLIIGETKAEQICIVSHCYRDHENVIRIISARRATRTEQRTYLDGI